MLPLDWDLDAYHFDLPTELIAQYPTVKRDHSRMMVLSRENSHIAHCHFFEIINRIPENAALVINNTKVFPARLLGHRATGGKIEALLLKENSCGRWEALIKRAKRIQSGEQLFFANDQIQAKAIERLTEGEWVLEFENDENLMEKLNRYALSPLPPYIQRTEEMSIGQKEDRERYQTCYAKNIGAVAAPTAGLHFTPEILERLKQKGIPIIEVTLHIGKGTFTPIHSRDIRKHQIHEEYFEISSSNRVLLQQMREEKRKLIAVGTTCVRVLETLANNETISSGWTKVFIYPPYRFQWVQGILTNFHLPRSTLILLVAAFYTREKLMPTYQKAIECQYRFYSYGDCMLIL